jgi:LPXTG-motif cell wall-anchored protein
VTSTPLLLPPTGSSSVLDASGLAGILIALAGLGLVLVTRRRGAVDR